jgi:hypothetical protein
MSVVMLSVIFLNIDILSALTLSIIMLTFLLTSATVLNVVLQDIHNSKNAQKRERNLTTLGLLHRLHCLSFEKETICIKPILIGKCSLLRPLFLSVSKNLSFKTLILNLCFCKSLCYLACFITVSGLFLFMKRSSLTKRSFLTRS